MRAVFLENKIESFSPQAVEVLGERHHHLSRVVRIKIGEPLLVFFGDGLWGSGKVLEITKKKTTLEIEKIEKQKDCRFIHLVIGTPKKEAFESVIKMAIECGVKKITQVQSEYAQVTEVKKERIQALCESAMIQSNNPFDLQVDKALEFDELEETIKKAKLSFVLDPKAIKHHYALELLNHGEEIVLLVGPEGGWSTREREYLSQWGAQSVKLGEFIMRTPTAVAVGLGFARSAVKLEIDAL